MTSPELPKLCWFNRNTEKAQLSNKVKVIQITMLTFESNGTKKAISVKTSPISQKLRHSLAVACIYLSFCHLLKSGVIFVLFLVSI